MRTPSLPIINTAQEFVGEYQQTVPQFSAAKQDGQPLYKLARQGKTIKPKSKVVTISQLDIVAYKYPLVTLNVACSSGTYVRQLTYDIFQRLNLESFLFFLERTQIGQIQLNQACELAALNDGSWVEWCWRRGQGFPFCPNSCPNSVPTNQFPTLCRACAICSRVKVSRMVCLEAKRAFAAGQTSGNLFGLLANSVYFHFLSAVSPRARSSGY